MIEPRHWVWIVEGRLAIAERPGGGGRSHRVLRRDAELEWWAQMGVDAVVSAMRSRHGLLEAALRGFAVRWHPLFDPTQARRQMPELIDDVNELLGRPGNGAVLVHVDRPSEWVAAVDAALRLSLGAAATPAQALEQAAADGWPVGPVTAAIVGVPPSPGRARAQVAA